MKNILIILIICTLFLSSCSAIETLNHESITFSVLYNNDESNPFNEDWLIFKEYKELKNVNLDVRLGNNTDYEKDIALSLMSDNKPDVILKCYPDSIVNYVNDGTLLPISDYEHLMPYFTSYIEKNNLEDELDLLRQDNGKYYLLPGYQRQIQVQQWIYRQDAFYDNGLAAPTTYDELFDSLIILKDIYPDSTPITASWGGAHIFSMIGAGYGIPAGWRGVQYYNAESDTWLFAPATDNYKQMHRFLNKCYEADLLDPDIFTQSNEDFIEKIKNGQALVTVTWISSGFNGWDNALKENGYPNGTWKPLPVMESTIGIKALPAVSKYYKGLAISSDAEQKPYFEEMIAFLDWVVYSEEGINLTYWGVEGITYETTNYGKAFLPEIATPKNPDGTINIMKEYGMNCFFDLNECAEYTDYKMPDYIVEFLAESEKNQETLPEDPSLILTPEETEMINIANEKLLPYISSASTKFITGELSIEDDWDIYINKLDELGYTMIETVWNNAWSRQK